MKFFATLAKQLDDPSALFCGQEVESDVNTGWANLFKWIVLPGDPGWPRLSSPWEVWVWPGASNWILNLMKMRNFFLFSCPEQLNRWPCHSLTDWVSEWVTFRFWHYSVALETCDLWDIWSEWWGDLIWPQNRPTYYLPTYLPALENTLKEQS